MPSNKIKPFSGHILSTQNGGQFIGASLGSRDGVHEATRFFIWATK
jgi:hypothetical protein